MWINDWKMAHNQFNILSLYLSLVALALVIHQVYNMSASDSNATLSFPGKLLSPKCEGQKLTIQSSSSLAKSGACTVSVMVTMSDTGQHCLLSYVTMVADSQATLRKQDPPTSSSHRSNQWEGQGVQEGSSSK